MEDLLERRAAQASRGNAVEFEQAIPGRCRSDLVDRQLPADHQFGQFPSCRLGCPRSPASLPPRNTTTRSETA
jgi:hypothetical protein